MLLLPHGGFCNSGRSAAWGFRLLSEMEGAPDGGCPPVVVVIGNSHYQGGVMLSDQRWVTPLGVVEPHRELIKRLQELGGCV